MPQVFHPAWNTIARVLLVGLPVASAVGWLGLAYGLTDSNWFTNQNLTHEQPVMFSHAHHVGGLGIDCRFCHTAVTQGPYAGLPATKVCMTCHSQLWLNAGLLAPVRESLASGKPIAWERVHDLPDYVYFDHSVHVAKGMGCSECHGNVAQMPLMTQVAPLTMGWCLDCHRHPEGRLRPREEVFNMEWTPPADRETLGRQLVMEYHVKKEQLTNCSVCHR